MTGKSVQRWFTGGGFPAVEQVTLTLAHVVVQPSPKEERHAVVAYFEHHNLDKLLFCLI